MRGRPIISKTNASVVSRKVWVGDFATKLRVAKLATSVEPMETIATVKLPDRSAIVLSEVNWNVSVALKSASTRLKLVTSNAAASTVSENASVR